MTAPAMRAIAPPRRRGKSVAAVFLGFLVVFVIVVLAAQGLMLSYMMSQPTGVLRGRSPNNLAAIVAADIGTTLTHDASADVGEYLNRAYGHLQPIYLVLRDGRTPANRSAPLPEGMKRSVEAILAGTDLSEWEWSLRWADRPSRWHRSR